jgi:probable F420-dependent oxidoreductase
MAAVPLSSRPFPPRPFRFGVQANGTTDRAAWVGLARQVEALGYSTLTMPDHFTEQFAPVPALMTAAGATDRLRVGALVWSNDYRHPVVLAKELATMDVLSDGRLEIGLGTGWMTSDYTQAGLPYDRAGVRISRMAEAIDVLCGAFGDGAFDFAGTHYTISGYDGWPKPVQRPRPPVLIGGGGRRVLELAARQADIVGINPTLTAGAIGPEALASMTADAVDEKVAWVQHAAGARAAEIELNIRTFVVRVTHERERAAEELAAFAGFTADAVLASPFVVVGTPAQIASDLRERRERYGFSYVIVGQEDVEPFAPVVAELAGN